MKRKLTKKQQLIKETDFKLLDIDQLSKRDKNYLARCMRNAAKRFDKEK